MLEQVLLPRKGPLPSLDAGHHRQMSRLAQNQRPAALGVHLPARCGRGAEGWGQARHAGGPGPCLLPRSAAPLRASVSLLSAGALPVCTRQARGRARALTRPGVPGVGPRSCRGRVPWAISFGRQRVLL